MKIQNEERWWDKQWRCKESKYGGGDKCDKKRQRVGMGGDKGEKKSGGEREAKDEEKSGGERS